MNHAFRRPLVAALMATSALAAAPAFAQDTAADDAAEGDVIIVTAQKRSENLQDVPISIQAFGEAKLKNFQVASFDDYAKLLPSVSFQSFGPGQSQIYFRGVSSGANANGSHSGPQPTSALYVDEVPLTTIGGAPDLHVYDIERVEALSGPQGTLFGASSLSGLLRLITKKPNPDEFEAGVDLTGTTFAKGSNSSGGTAEGFINVPLSPMAAIRGSAFYKREGGFISNVPGTRTYQVFNVNDDLVPFTVNNSRFVEKNFNETETYGGRLALGIDLDDNWTVTPSIIYQNQKSNGTYLFDPAVGDLQVQDYTPEFGSDEWYQAMLTINGKLGNWDLTYAGGYFERDTDLTQDYSSYTVAYDSFAPSYASFIDSAGRNIDPTQTYRGRDNYTKQTHELRISSPAGERYKLTAGVFYERQTDFIKADYIIPGLASIPGGLAVPTCGDDIFCTRVNRIDRDYAGFVDASFDILPNLTVNGGIRYFKTKNSLAGFSGFASTVGSPDCPATTGPYPCLLFDKTVEETGETHKVNLTWKIDPDKMLYATYSTGFRPGGINRRVGVNPYKSDKLDNFEVGFKSQLLDRTLTFNVAAFYENWKSLQYGLAAFGSVGVISTYNAGDAHIYGVEGDFNWRIGALTLAGSATYIDAKLVTDFCPIDTTGNPNCSGGNIAAPKGTRLPIQPKFKGGLSARYAYPVGSVDAYVQAGVNHQSGTRSNLNDLEAGLLGDTKGFTTVDAAIGGKWGNYTFELFAQNLFDERGILSVNTVCVPTICGAYARSYPIKPQMFGVKAGWRY